MKRLALICECLDNLTDKDKRLNLASSVTQQPKCDPIQKFY